MLAGVVCYAAVSLKFRFGYDDSLDVVGVHLVGGIVGSLLVGVLAQASVGGVDGALFGNFAQVWYQAVGVVAVVGFSFVATWLIALLVDAVVGLRAEDGEEDEGLDISFREERAYVLADWVPEPLAIRSTDV